MVSVFQEDVFDNFLRDKQEEYNKSLSLFSNISAIKKYLPNTIPLFSLNGEKVTVYPNIKLPTDNFINDDNKKDILENHKTTVEEETKNYVGKLKWQNFEKALTKKRVINLSRFLTEQFKDVQLKDHMIRDFSYIIPNSQANPELKYAYLPEEYARVWSYNYGTCFKTIHENERPRLEKLNPSQIIYAEYAFLQGHHATDFFARSPQFLGVYIEDEKTKKPIARTILYRQEADKPFTFQGFIRSNSPDAITRFKAALLKNNYTALSYTEDPKTFKITIPFELPILTHPNGFSMFAFPTCNEFHLPISIEINDTKKIATVGKPGIQTYTTYHYNGWFVLR